MERNNRRVGILGGMGPMAGVTLQKLIIENTPAAKDQDHVEVVCFTNPHIPDRTGSLQADNGSSYVSAIIDSVKVLEQADVDCILIPCNTAHARFKDIQGSIRVPILNMVDITLRKVRKFDVSTVGLLATDGTIASQVFGSDENLKIILPDAEAQKEIMRVIYEIKAGKYNDDRIASKIDIFVKGLKQKGAQKVILGCTEFSLYFPFLEGKDIIDPLLELAKEAIIYPKNMVSLRDGIGSKNKIGA